jgi:pimeloyl-ACP methyl ester carboxylesterase
VLIGPTVDPRSRSWLPLLGLWLANSVREHPRMGPLNLADYRDAGPRRVLGSFAAALRDPVEEKLPLIEVPALVVRGEYDRLAPQPWAEEVTRLLARPAGGAARPAAHDPVPGSRHTHPPNHGVLRGSGPWPR